MDLRSLCVLLLSWCILFFLNFFLAFYFLLFFSFIFISWRLIILQYCSGFCHTLTWIHHGFTCIPHPDPPTTSLSTRSLWVFPVHQTRALVSCIQPGLVICFTIDNTHVSMLFSQIIPPSPSPIESKSLFLHICVSFSVLHIGLSLPSFKIPYICVSILYWSLSFWLTSLYIMGSSFIHLIRTDSNEFFLMAE